MQGQSRWGGGEVGGPSLGGDQSTGSLAGWATYVSESSSIWVGSLLALRVCLTEMPCESKCD